MKPTYVHQQYKLAALKRDEAVNLRFLWDMVDDLFLYRESDHTKTKNNRRHDKENYALSHPNRVHVQAFKKHVSAMLAYIYPNSEETISIVPSRLNTLVEDLLSDSSSEEEYSVSVDTEKLMKFHTNFLRYYFSSPESYFTQAFRTALENAALYGLVCFGQDWQDGMLKYKAYDPRNSLYTTNADDQIDNTFIETFMTRDEIEDLYKTDDNEENLKTELDKIFKHKEDRQRAVDRKKVFISTIKTYPTHFKTEESEENKKQLYYNCVFMEKPKTNQEDNPILVLFEDFSSIRNIHIGLLYKFGSTDTPLSPCMEAVSSILLLQTITSDIQDNIHTIAGDYGPKALRQDLFNGQIDFRNGAINSFSSGSLTDIGRERVTDVIQRLREPNELNQGLQYLEKFEASVSAIFDLDALMDIGGSDRMTRVEVQERVQRQERALNINYDLFIAQVLNPVVKNSLYTLLLSESEYRDGIRKYLINEQMSQSLTEEQAKANLYNVSEDKKIEILKPEIVNKVILGIDVEYNSPAARSKHNDNLQQTERMLQMIGPLLEIPMFAEAFEANIDGSKTFRSTINELGLNKFLKTEEDLNKHLENKEIAQQQQQQMSEMVELMKSLPKQ